MLPYLCVCVFYLTDQRQKEEKQKQGMQYLYDHQKITVHLSEIGEKKKTQQFQMNPY